MSDHSVLVIGSTGQLALSLAERAAADAAPVTLLGRPRLDLLDHHSIRAAVRASKAKVIINAAAYTAVDQAESEPELAAATNAVAPGVIADAAREVGARLIHISTDYVYDGNAPGSYVEDAPTAPLGVYGRTKLNGEAAVRAALPDHLIVRTSWVYSPFGRNFVKTMLTLAQTRPELRVVDDQLGTPTSALDLADGLLRVARHWEIKPDAGLGQTFHLAGNGETSWAGLAREALKCSRAAGGPWAAVVPIGTADWPTPAARPSNSRLDSSRFAAAFGYRAPPWQESLHAVVHRLLQPAQPSVCT